MSARYDSLPLETVCVLGFGLWASWPLAQLVNRSTAPLVSWSAGGLFCWPDRVGANSILDASKRKPIRPDTCRSPLAARPILRRRLDWPARRRGCPSQAAPPQLQLNCGPAQLSSVQFNSRPSLARPPPKIRLHAAPSDTHAHAHTRTPTTCGFATLPLAHSPANSLANSPANSHELTTGRFLWAAPEVGPRPPRGWAANLWRWASMSRGPIREEGWLAGGRAKLSSARALI